MENPKLSDENQRELIRVLAEWWRMVAALELIASGPRPDGTYNRDRAACRELALETLRGTAWAESRHG